MGDAFRGKVLVDTSNLITKGMEYDGNLKQSGAEDVQSWAKEAKVVKAFNTVFSQHMSTGQVEGERVSLLVACDYPTAKKQVMSLGQDIGFDAVDARDLSNARWLETLGVLNITMAYAKPKLGPRFGLRVLGLASSRSTSPPPEGNVDRRGLATSPTEMPSSGSPMGNSK